MNAEGFSGRATDRCLLLRCALLGSLLFLAALGGLLVPATADAQGPSFTLSNSGGITVTQGASGANTITATLTAGATQSVSFSASGLPSGASASFSVTSCSPTCSSTLTITAATTTPTGTFSITVTGNPLGRTTAF